MYVHELTLTNVRQFAQRTFSFLPGFNLLVGENGAGKSTLLRSLQAALTRSTRERRPPPLTDEDVRLNTSQLRVDVTVASPSSPEINRYSYSHRFGRRSTRTHSPVWPVVLYYASNEATCGSFIGRRVRRYAGVFSSDTTDKEAWLFEQQSKPSQRPVSQSHFGRSEDIREFVRQILSRFSRRFRDFRWSFEPFDCALESAEGKSTSIEPTTRRAFQNAILRHLQETGNPLADIDKPLVFINSRGYLQDDDTREPVTPPFNKILSTLKADEADMEILSNSTVKVRLTPRIRILDEEGDSFLLSQLSDGEQRLFSLFVDIARQLSLGSPGNVSFKASPAIVLIDEIDVHLHPKWQRTIVPALEDLFSAIQFIATTHSPFVVQAVSEDKVQPLSGNILGDFTDRGIEEIALKVMGIEDHQVSSRYLEMLDTAKEYFLLLEQARDGRGASPNELAQLKHRLSELSQRYARNPAYQAYLELHGTLALGPDEMR